MTEKTQENLKPRESSLTRPPVVVVMGHVDHGKTTLLDYIRKANVAGKEAGGITQAIGAYEIEHTNSAPSPSGSSNTKAPTQIGRKITFIDTPGHEAFTKMRSRGAQIADLAILVVAAEEGLKPQTKESIKILTDAKLPYIVAINKIDKPEANIEKVKNELTANGVPLEGYGGHISFEPVSAKTGENVDKLLDLILLAADYENLTFNPALPASGFILEAKLASRRGIEAVVIIKNGTLKQNDLISTPSAKGKVKILENFLDEKASELLPSSPALIIGFEKPPQVGEEFKTGSASELLDSQNGSQTRTLTTVSEKESSLRFIIKSSDQGSLEAISAIIRNLPCEKKVIVIDEGVGDITDGDVKNASATNAIILGFKNKISKAAQILADAQKVRVETSPIIYELVKLAEDILRKPEAAAIKGKLEILAVFNQAKLHKQLIGGKVLEGIMKNKANLEIFRLVESPTDSAETPAKLEEKLIGHGKILSVQAGKLEVNQVESGKECGLIVDSKVALQKGDSIIIK